jgi:LysM repeat protein
VLRDGLPDSRFVRGALLAFGVAFALGVYLLIAPPTLPHERERTGGAPPPATAVPGARSGGGGSPAAPSGPAPTPPATDDRPAVTPAPAASPQPARRHTIRAGDTLLDIAEQYDTTVDAIRAANPGLNETALTIGQEITIPPSR